LCGNVDWVAIAFEAQRMSVENNVNVSEKRAMIP